LPEHRSVVGDEVVRGADLSGGRVDDEGGWCAADGGEPDALAAANRAEGGDAWQCRQGAEGGGAYCWRGG
jgi:hypothetical protein